MPLQRPPQRHSEDQMPGSANGGISERSGAVPSLPVSLSLTPGLLRGSREVSVAMLRQKENISLSLCS